MEFYSVNKFLKEKFGKKVVKLSVDGGFTCPNRDGKVGNKGCIFCSEHGSGEFAGDRKDSILLQMEKQVKLLSDKWKDCYYIAYFQCFTNTYDTVENLRKLYDEALSFPNVVGLAIATRADCLGDEIIELLSEYNKKTFLWVEIGLQTIHKKTSNFIRRGYDLEVFDKAIEDLNKNNILSVAHIIASLPYETKEDTIESVKYVCKKGVWGIKIHMLNVTKGTDLEKIYEKEKFHLLSADEYIELIIDILKILPENVVVHRITGDGKKEDLIAPRWILNKRYVLNSVSKYKI